MIFLDLTQLRFTQIWQPLSGSSSTNSIALLSTLLALKGRKKFPLHHLFLSRTLSDSWPRRISASLSSGGASRAARNRHQQCTRRTVGRSVGCPSSPTWFSNIDSNPTDRIYFFYPLSCLTSPFERNRKFGAGGALIAPQPKQLTHY